MMEKDADVIIIGAGHNSLAAALYLQQAGHKVLIIELAKELGGAAKTAELLEPGFKHDVYATNIGQFLGSRTYEDFKDKLHQKGFDIIAVNHPFSNVFPDKKCIRVYTDAEKTVKEFEKYSARSKNFTKFMSNMNAVAMFNPRAAELVQKSEAEFYNMLKEFKFLPNSPTLMNAGRDLQQLSACFVLPVGDSIEEIYGAVTNMAIVHKSGGGTGFSFSRLRPNTDVVKTTKGIASGPLSFMKIFDTSTDVVKQGGTRRGANMGILHYTHPDIKKFITSKTKDKAMFENFNISVALDDRFMKAVDNNEEYELLNPRNGEVLGRENAKDVFNLI